ncbi:MAG: ADP-ribosylglycohydrolase family protein [Gemmataceae bacterium]
MKPDLGDKLAGVLLGTAVGDALGVPREGLSPHRAERLFGTPPLRQRFFFGRGMVSDDTEHTCLLGRALLQHPDRADDFERALAWELRRWFVCLPSGLGRATLRALLKLMIGFPPARSGVFSAGNGPAMRSALLGVCLGHDPGRLKSFVHAATWLTHTDPRAERGALLVALAAHLGAEQGPSGVHADRFFALVREQIPDADAELTALLDRLQAGCHAGTSSAELARAMGLEQGITGYIYHTVPLALYGWLRHPADFRAAVTEVIALGGDADTTGAIVGAICGATVGAGSIPTEWIEGIADWPFSTHWMRTLAQRLTARFTEEGETTTPRIIWPGLLGRNLFFLAVVLAHAARRLLPPYG